MDAKLVEYKRARAIIGVIAMIKVHFITKNYSKELGRFTIDRQKSLDLEELIKAVGCTHILSSVDLTKDVYLGINPYAEDVHGTLEYIASNSLEELRKLQYEYAQDI